MRYPTATLLRAFLTSGTRPLQGQTGTVSNQTSADASSTPLTVDEIYRDRSHLQGKVAVVCGVCRGLPDENPFTVWLVGQPQSYDTKQIGCTFLPPQEPLSADVQHRKALVVRGRVVIKDAETIMMQECQVVS